MKIARACPDFLHCCLLFLVAVWQVVQPVHAATIVWQGTTDPTWSDASNWSPATVAPGSGDTAVFSNAGNGNVQIDLGAEVALLNLQFSSAAAAAYTLGTGGANAQSLLLENGGAITLDAAVVNDQQMDAALTLGQDAAAGAYALSNHSTTNGLILAGDIAGGAGGIADVKTLSVGGAGTVLISGIISDGGSAGLGIVKNDGGTLTLAGANTFSGGVTLNDGTLRVAVDNAGALGTGALMLNGGTLNLVNDTNLTYGNNTTVAGDVTITSDRVTSAATTTTFTLGVLTIGGQTLTTQRGANITSTSAGNVTFSSTTMTGNAVFAPRTRTTLRLGAVSDGGNGYMLTAAGSGTGATLQLVGTGAWSGGTLLTGGTLRVDSADGLGANGADAGNRTVTIITAGTLQLRNGNAARNNRLIDFQGSGTLQLVNSATTTWNIGALQLSAGNFTLTSQRATGTGAINHTFNTALALNGNLTLNVLTDVTLILGGVISEASGASAVTKTGGGTARIGAQATYSGLTTVNNGELRLNVAEALPSGAGKGDFTMTPASSATATLNLNGNSQTLNGFSSSGAGTSVVDNVSATAATLTMGANDGTGSFSGTLQNSGAGTLSLTKTGAGLITLDGSGTYTGVTSVNGGILAVQPAVLVNSTAVNVGTTGSGSLAFAPDGTGDVMTLAADTNLTVGSGSTWGGLVFQLGADTASSDRIALQGSGVLTVGAAGGFISGLNLGTFTAGSFDLVTGPNAIVGGANLQLGSLPGGFIYSIDTTTDPTKLTLSAVAAGGGDLFWTGDVDDSWATLAGGDSNWSTAQGSNVEAGFTPGASNTVNFSAAGGGNFSTLLDNYYSVAGLNVLSGGSAVTIAEGVIGGLTLGAGGIDVQTGAPAVTTISAAVTVGASQNWNVVDFGSTLLVSGNVGGSADVTKTGAGTLTLSGDNTLTGSLTLSTGTLNVNSATALGAGVFVIGGGTLDNTRGAPLILSTNNAQTWNGDFAFTGTNDFDFGTGDVTLGADVQVTVNGGLLAVQKVTGAFGLTKQGTGVLEVGAGGDYTGTTQVNAGILRANGTNSLSAGSAYTLGASGTLQLNNQSQVIGSLSGSGTVENNGGTATDTLTLGGDNSSTTFSGVLQDGATGFLALVKAGTGTFTLSGSSSTATGTMRVDGGILAITGTMNNGLGDTDAGTVDNTTGMIYVPAGGSLSTELISLGNGTVARNGSLVIRGGDVTLTTTTTGAGIDAGNGGYGTVALQSGTLALNRLDSSNNGNGTAVFRVDGGTLTSNEYLIFRNANTEFTVTGGQVLHNVASQNIALSYQNAGNTVMTVAGGVVNNTGRDLTFGQTSTSNAGYTATLNLTGGNLITDRIVSTARGASVSTVNFNGGTLTATVNDTGFFSAATGLTAYVHGGGALIDTAGSNVTISAALQAPTGDGLTGLTVSSAGSGYIGAPYVQITGDGTGATGYAVVDLDPASGTFGQVTGVVITNPGIGYSTAAVTLLGGGGSGAVIDTPVFGANSSGGLSKTGGGTLTLSGNNTYTGLTSITGGTLALGVNDALADGAVTIESGAIFDVVTFTDSVGQVTLLNGSIAGTTGVLTSTADYDLQSGSVSAILAGTVGLNKTTAGTVALSGANTFSGLVSVTAGTLAFEAATNLGDASATNTLVVNGGTLSYTGVTTATLAAAQTLAVGTSGATLDTAFAAGVLELTGGITAAATTSLTKTGPGTVSVTGSINLQGGNVTVSGGTLNSGFTAGGISGIQVDGGGALNLYDGATVTAAITALSLADGSALGFDLNAPGTNDVLALTGALTLAGTIALNFNDLGGLAVGAYDLITSTGAGLNGATFVLGAAPSGLNYTFDPTVSGNTILRLTTSSLALRYWQGDQGGSWSTNNAGDTNWATDAAGTTDLNALPAATDTLVFSTTNNVQGPAISTTLDGNFTADSLQFIASPSGIASFAIAQGSSGVLTITPQSANNGISVADNAGAVSISAPLNVGAAQTWEVIGTGVNGSSLAIAGDVTFSHPVTKTGDGVLTLSGSNAGAGGLTVNGGTLNVASSTAPGAGTLTTGAGVTLDNTSGGALTLTNNNLLAFNGSFTFTGSHALDLGSGGVTLGNNAVINVLASTLTLGGNVNDGGSTYALTKDGAGTLVLNGTNTHSGGTTLAKGTLHLGSASALGAGSFTIGAGTTFDNTSGGAFTLAANNAQTWQGDFTFTGSDALNLGTGAVTMDAPVAVNVVASTLTVGGVLDDGVNANALTKTGAGTLVLTAANTYDGRTLIDEGTLRIGANNALPVLTVVRLGSGTTAGTLNLGSFDQTIAGLRSESTTNSVTNNIIIAAGKTLTVNGEVILGADAAGSSTRLVASGGGSLIINSGGTDFQIGGSTVNTNTNAAEVDFSGLSSFTADLGLGTLRIGDISSITTTNTPTSTLRLATDSTITAGLIRIGDGTPPQNTGSPHTMVLGSGTNILNANVIAVGSGNSTTSGNNRSSGQMIFDAGDTTGALKIRGSDGIARAAISMVSSVSTSGNSFASTIDLSGHDADILASSLNMARRTGATGNGSATATLTFDQGTFDLNTLDMARRSTSGTGDATATLNIGGGIFTVNSTTTMSVNAGSNAASETTATINISGGTVTFTGAINMGNAAVGQTATSTINITGGTVTSVPNITRTGGAGTENATIILDGGMLDMTSSNIGTAANSITFDARSGTLRNLNQLNGGGTLEKTTTGTLTFDTANSYSGATLVSAGVLVVSDAGALGTIANGTSIAAGGTLQLAGGISVAGESLAMTADAGGNAVLSSFSGANTWTGDLTVDTGADAANRTRILSEAGSSLLISGNVGLSAGTQDFVIGGDGDGEISGQITGSQRLFKSSAGAGTWTLSGDNSSSFTGRISVGNGALQVASEANLGAVPASFVANQLTLGGGSAAGTLATTGTMSLSSNRGVTLGTSGGVFDTAASTTLTVDGVVTGAGPMTKAGGGTLISTAVNTNTGITTVAAGVLGGTGTLGGDLSVSSGGTVAPGIAAEGVLTVAGNLTLNSGSTLLMQLGGATLNAAADVGGFENNLSSLDAGTISVWEATAVSLHDQLAVLGAAVPSIDGTIKIDATFLNGYAPAFGDVFDLVDWSAVGNIGGSASFDFTGVTLAGGLGFSSELFASNGILVVVPEPGRALFLMLGLFGLMSRRRR